MNLIGFCFFKQPKHLEQFGSITGYYIGYRVSKAENQQFTFSTVELSNPDDYSTGQLNGSLPLNSTAGQYEHLLGNLKKATTYTVIVQAFNSKGAGPPSAESQIKTKGIKLKLSHDNIKLNLNSFPFFVLQKKIHHRHRNSESPM